VDSDTELIESDRMREVDWLAAWLVWSAMLFEIGEKVAGDFGRLDDGWRASHRGLGRAAGVSAMTGD